MIIFLRHFLTQTEEGEANRRQAESNIKLEYCRDAAFDDGQNTEEGEANDQRCNESFKLRVNKLTLPYWAPFEAFVLNNFKIHNHLLFRLSNT